MQKPQKKGKAQRKDDDRLASPPVVEVVSDLKPPAKEESALTQLTGSVEMPVAKILDNPRQPRKGVDEERLCELAASIEEHGVLQPILVGRSDEANDLYVLIDGWRRLLACKRLGKTTIPAIIRAGAGVATAFPQFHPSEDLKPIDEAERFTVCLLFWPRSCTVAFQKQSPSTPMTV